MNLRPIGDHNDRSTWMQQQLDYVLRTVEERGVRFVRLWFTDVLGFLKSFAITPAELESALEEGMTFDGSAIQGYSRVQESDMLAVPDPNTFEIVPWRGDDAPVGRMFCDIQNLSGEPFDGDPRYVLKRNLDRAREKGFTFYSSPDMEFFYFRSAESPEPLDHAGFFDLVPGDMVSDLRKQTILMLEAMGIPVEYSFHELGPSQHEIDLRYTDALTMADNVMTFRLIVKQVAQSQGVYATFMPKPIQGAFGSGMHTHLSLFEGDVNAFHDPGDAYGLSKVGKHFIAGLLCHAGEITAVTNQWINSYKRLIIGYEAPTYVCWARNNESALVRVPIPKRGKESSTRIEFRSPDPACNPYLAFSVMLAAGLKGIEEGYELPPEATNNIYEMTPEERRAEGIGSLPQSLAEALELMEGSELVAETLGEHVFEYFIKNKRKEWDEYTSYVTPFEVDRYLGTL
jgi:glutamine synthetase